MSIPDPDQTHAPTGSPGVYEVPPHTSNGDYDPAGHLSAAARHLSEAGTYVGQYISAKISGVMFGVRKLALMAALGVVAGLVGATILITGAALLVIGLAMAIAALLTPGWWWVGPVVVGLLIVGLTVGGLLLMMKRISRLSKRAAVEAYRSDLRQQRARFGNDAFSRSVGRAAELDLEAREARTRTPQERQAFRQKRHDADEAERQIEADLSRLKGD